MYDVFKRKVKGKDEWFIPHTICGVTVTHQARLNLIQHIPNCTTYASAANLIMEIDPNGQIYFVESKHSFKLSELRRYKTIIVDECSMFDQHMVELLRKCTDSKCKIIWTGDHHQLPPVTSTGDNDSPTFSFNSKYELTQIMRQSEDNNIIELCNTVCAAIDGDQNMDFINKLKNKWDKASQKGYAITSLQGAINSFVANFRKGDVVRITSFRNRRINEINDIVRTFLWEDKYEQMFVDGEFIVLNDQFAPDGFPLAYNGETFIVNYIIDETVDSIPCHVLAVDSKLEDGEVIYLPVPTSKGQRVYKQRVDSLKYAAKLSKDWGEYFRFKQQFANVSYGYCVSNYKIQGATTKGCYVDLSDILDVKMISNKRKLQAFYVGISRPTDYLAIF